MALRYCQSWDYFTTALLQANVEGTAINSPTISASGRFGNAIQITSQNVSWDQPNDSLAAAQTLIFGCAFKMVLGTAPSFDLMKFQDAAGIAHVSLRVNASRQLEVTRGGSSGGVILVGPWATALNIGQWYYIEIKVKIDDTTGTAEVRVDGTTVLTATGLDTRNGGVAASAVKFRLSGWNNTSNYSALWDDIYFLDGSGSAPNNDFLGDVRVQWLAANGNGNTSNLVGNDGNSTDNYLLVDEATSDSDTDYVESATVGNKDTYAMVDATPTSGVVFGVRPVMVARKTDAGTRKAATVVRVSGTEVDGPDQNLTTDYANLYDMRETKPGGGAWSISDVNAMEVGVKVTV